MEDTKTSEAYLPGYTDNASSFMARRTAQSHAAFLLPKLRPGLRLLDCGRGPGSITLGLARLVSPGEVVGLDQESSQIEIARNSAAAHNLPNARFEVSSLYQLPFPAETFDVVFAHAVFEHLREPMTALAEIHRVLKADGLVALRSPDWGGFLVAPESEPLTAALAYYQSLQTQRGGDVHIGRKFKTMLRQAGFRDLAFSASYECYSSLEFIGEYLAQGTERSLENATAAAERGRIEGFAATLRTWARGDDGIFAQSWCEIVGQKLACHE